MVGPNCGRFARAGEEVPPGSKFSVIADHAVGIQQLSDALKKANVQAEVLLDLDVGQHRTGIAAGPAARQLYEIIAKSPGLKPGGFHVYDGHNHQHPLEERKAAVQAMADPGARNARRADEGGAAGAAYGAGRDADVSGFRDHGDRRGGMLAGNVRLERCQLRDLVPDLGEFTHAALLLTRVISRPTATRVTFDSRLQGGGVRSAGGKRCVLLDVKRGARAAKRGAPGDRDAGRRGGSSRAMWRTRCRSCVPDVGAASVCVCRRERPGRGSLGDCVARPYADPMMG